MEISPELAEEMYAALFRIVRQSMLGQAIGHDTMVQCRSIVRRVNPSAYAILTFRRDKAGLPARKVCYCGRELYPAETARDDPEQWGCSGCFRIPSQCKCAVIEQTEAKREKQK